MMEDITEIHGRKVLWISSVAKLSHEEAATNVMIRKDFRFITSLLPSSTCPKLHKSRLILLAVQHGGLRT